MRKIRYGLLLALMWVLSSCAGEGAVVFAPTPPPPDVSPLRYVHPSGAFSIVAPRTWGMTEQYVENLAVTSFSLPDDFQNRLHIAVIRVEPSVLNMNNINEWIDDYQAQGRFDAARYTEQSREAMGDGSWRITGLRQLSGGMVQQVNTFIEIENEHIAVIDVILSEDVAVNEQLEQFLNTFRLEAQSQLIVTDISTLTLAAPMAFEPLNVHAWTSPNGAFFVTGEVVNRSFETVTDLPVRVILYTEDGRAVAEAIDVVMGYGVPSGGFAPFSLRFGQGQPALTNRYVVSFGNETWRNDPQMPIYGQDVLQTRDESNWDESGQLTITGDVTNISNDVFVYVPRLTVTVFDDQQRVIAAAFQDLDEVEIAPSQSIPFQFLMTELGGIPDRYIVMAQGKP